MRRPGDAWDESEEAFRGFNAPRLPGEVDRRLGSSEPLTEEEVDEVHVLEHDVPVGSGRVAHVTERFAMRSWSSRPRRAALLLPGTVVTGSFYNLEVDGYRFAEMLARQGFFVFAMDLEGTGRSAYPRSGLDVTHASLVAGARVVLSYIRWIRQVPRVDAVGEINGGAIAAELCDADCSVRSCVLSSMLYRKGTPFFQERFLDPGFLGFLASRPDGYLDVTPDLYFNITARTSPEVSAAVLATQPGRYAVQPLMEPVAMPWFDPRRARVPALIVQGTEDNIATQADGDHLAAMYGSAPGAGGTAEVLRIAGSGHIPRIEPGANETWSRAVIDFLTTDP